jgi:hypothetical protein
MRWTRTGRCEARDLMAQLPQGLFQAVDPDSRATALR